MNTTNLKNKFELLFFLALFSTTAFSQNFSSSLIKTTPEKIAIKKALESSNKDDEVDTSQMVRVTTTEGYFYIVPVLSRKPTEEGCYIQIISSDFKPNSKYLVEKSEDAQSCDAVQAIYSCKLSDTDGIGVIAGIRLGFDHYYSTNTFFNFSKNNELQINAKLTKLINSTETVAKSKKKLGCGK